MNSRHEEITRFLDRDLLPQVRQELSRLGTDDRTQLEQDYQEDLEQAKRYGVAEPEPAPPVVAARTKLEATACAPSTGRIEQLPREGVVPAAESKPRARRRIFRSGQLLSGLHPVAR
jgi:hypothetical protein